MCFLELVVNILILSAAPWPCWSSVTINEFDDRALTSGSNKCRTNRWDPQRFELYCGVDGEADKFLEWTWITASYGSTRDSSRGTPIGQDVRRLLDGRMRLGLARSALVTDQLKRQVDLQLSHKAKIYFPFWRPTENEYCEFSFMYLMRENELVKHSTKSDPNYGWPKLSVVLMSPKSASAGAGDESASESLADLRLLDTFEHSNQLDEAARFVARVGKQTLGTWSLVILVETKVNASLFELADMRLTNCSPLVDGGGGDRQPTPKNRTVDDSVDLERLFGQSCKNDARQFQCRLSGRCIDLDYRCDFGRDCGPIDDSDEFKCPAEFEGRCDFEDPLMCQWAPARAYGSWQWEQSSNQKKLIYSHKPPMDHTYQSRQTNGHYMIIEARQLDSFGTVQLIGPRVQLRANHQECKVRFWLNTPTSLIGAGMKSAYLTVGYGRVSASDLFGLMPKRKLTEASPSAPRREENGWRRFQLTLFNRSAHLPDSIFALHIAFGNLLSDLELFALADGYVALDDISFSQGCALTFYNQAPVSICGDTEFRCEYPPPLTPDQFCIPLNRVCDFKNDCGSHPADQSHMVNEPAGDEAMCLSYFSTKSKLVAGFEKLNGIQVANYKPADISFTQRANEAFGLELPKARADGSVGSSPFVVSSQFARFKENLKIKAKRHVKDIGILLPRFHQAHANCKLELKFTWSADAKNLLLSLYLLKSRTSTLFKRWNSPNAAGNRDHQVEHTIGIGEQNSPFNVYLEVSFKPSPQTGATAASNDTLDSENLAEFAGQFSLLRYIFQECGHRPGIVNVPQAHLVQVSELSDEEEDEEYEDPYRHESAPVVDSVPGCADAHFQCTEPILCISEQLVCDLQRDCQESGADELDCASRGSIQYNFESSEQLGKGWSPMDGASLGAKWIIAEVNRKLRIHHDVGPPVDHTAGGGLGGFLSLHIEASSTNFERGHSQNADKFGAWIYTPEMRTLHSCKYLVVYLYNWTPTEVGSEDRKDDFISLRITVRYFGITDGFTDRILIQSDESTAKRDWWERMEFALPHADSNCTTCQGARGFSIGFYASVTLHNKRIIPVIAIDDVSLGPKCELSMDPPSAMSDTSSGYQAAEKLDGEPSSCSNHSALEWLVIALFVAACSATLLAYLARTRHSRRRMGEGHDSQSSRDGADDFALDIIQM